MENVEVNGKIDLGIRKLVVAHVENAITFYGYLETEKDIMSDVKTLADNLCGNKDRLSEDPAVDQMVGVYNQSDKTWYRGRVEQLNMGKNKNQFRVRMIDFGWNGLYDLTDMVQIPKALEEKEVKLEKYKFVDLRAKGRDHGYSADDRQRGGNWLKKTIGNRVVVASCYKQKNYEGGIMADCMVGDVNLTKAALNQGHAIFTPSLIAGYIKSHNGGPMKPMRPPHFPQGGMGNGFGRQTMNGGAVGAAGGLDADYSNYVDGRARFNGGGMMNGGRQASGKKKQDKRDNRKKTNLDQGIKDLSRLLDRVNQARGQNPEKEAKGNNIVNCLVGVSQTIEEVSEVTEKYMSGIEAVDEANKKGDGAKGELKKSIEEYLDLYSDQVVDDETNRVANQLTAMQPSIPAGWKSLSVKAETITRANMMEVAESVKSWIESSVSKEAELTAISKKEMETFCRSLDQLSKSLSAREGGQIDAELPTSVDAELASVRQALQAELSCRNGPKITANSPNANNNNSNKKQKKNPNANADDAAKVLRSAWRALTALKSQLEFAKKKTAEFETLRTK
eukprot:TRINITY_DN7304_c0_g1_i5.p1 TRINITY_DN7304_c0_g1~~TRINITY_DN7304_c0_g1_i5.p1  ORF type:complete len:563 (-),score=191.05 TRINITY_DN7304_c0_g1_i5:1433-3121(-)